MSCNCQQDVIALENHEWKISLDSEFECQKDLGNSEMWQKQIFGLTDIKGIQ